MIKKKKKFLFRLSYIFEISYKKLKKEGFNLDIIDDPLYVMLPGESEYTPLTTEIYENIKNGLYKF